jgi:hypothetical protein
MTLSGIGYDSHRLCERLLAVSLRVRRSCHPVLRLGRADRAIELRQVGILAGLTERRCGAFHLLQRAIRCLAKVLQISYR